MATTPLKVLMAQMDVNVSELSHATGLSLTTISKYVNGKVVPHLDNAHLVADALGVSIHRCFPNYYRYDRIKRKRA